MATPARTRFADVYSAEWLSHLRRRLEPALAPQHARALEDFDLARLMSQDRGLTQQVATIAYQLDYDGIYYQFRHGLDLNNWALFEPFELQYMPPRSLTPDDKDLQNALRILNLSLDMSL